MEEPILVEFPYCPQNELVAKRFLSKFHQFINQKFQVTIKWITEKVKNLFSLKDKNPYPVNQIYKGTRVCDEIYIGETMLDGIGMRTYARNLNLQNMENMNHKCKWETLLQAP